MKLKSHNYHIAVRLKTPNPECPDANFDIWSSFMIKAVSVNPEQAMKIAAILFPSYKVKCVKFKNI